jgi:hypothetical protein
MLGQEQYNNNNKGFNSKGKKKPAQFSPDNLPFSPYQ